MPWRENKGVCQFKRILDGCFLVARAQEIFCGNLFLDVASQEINHRILDGVYAETKSLNKNP